MNLRKLWVPIAILVMTAAGCGGGGGGSGPPPTISQQPQATTVNAGQPATFSVTASGASTYQWQRNGQDIAGAGASSYTIAATGSQNNGDTYRVVVSNGAGSVTSDAAALRVTGVSVIAGQLGGFGYADGPAAQARFYGPVALAFDGSGDLYVADYGAVRKIAPDGTVSTVAGSPRECGARAGTGAGALFCYPSSLATDSAGNVYAGDFNGIVWQITPAGAASVFASGFGCPFGLVDTGVSLFVSDPCTGRITQLQAGAQSLYASVGLAPFGLATDGQQNLYVANDSVVQVVTPGPVTVTTIAGSAGVAGSADGVGPQARFGCSAFPWPFDLGAPMRVSGALGIATTTGQLSYVADYCNSTIRTVTATGTVSVFAGTTGVLGAADGTGTAAQFAGPLGMALDAAGNLYVADFGNALIRKITPAGVVSTYAGSTPHYGSADGDAATATFRYLRAMTADPSGNLYVVDGNHTIRKITAAGAVTTLAGTPGAMGSVDGTGSVARFHDPRGIVSDPSGNLYVADRMNSTIRKITPAGVVSTFAGRPGVTGQIDGTGSGALFARPTGLAVDASSNVYVTDGSSVRMITSAGVVTTILAPPGASATFLSIAVGSSGALYLTTYSAVYSLTVGGTLTLIAGGPVAGYADGTGPAARFRNAAGIVLAGDGNLYVADLENSTIRQVTPSGVVTTVVGTPVMPMEVVPGGLPARLNSPVGFALLSTGPQVSLAVADEWESVVLRVDLP
jgi:sugar lactone lactonase YvrE